MIHELQENVKNGIISIFGVRTLINTRKYSDHHGVTLTLDGVMMNSTSINLAVTYGFRMHCGAQTQVSNQVTIASSNIKDISSCRCLNTEAIILE